MVTKDLWSKLCSDGHALRQQHQTITTTLQAVIAEKAWTAAGYGSFYEGWIAAELDTITYEPEARTLATYQMIKDGRTDADIALAIKGIGPETVAIIRREKKAGRPAAPRKPPLKPPPSVVTEFVHIPRDQHVLIAREASDQGLSVAEFLLAAALAELSVTQ